MTDLEIKKDVEAELSFEPSVDAAAIGAAVKDGVVSLTVIGRRLRRNKRRCGLPASKPS
jgi:hypothetical protein